MYLGKEVRGRKEKGMRPVCGNYKVCGWQESLFFKVLALTETPTPPHCSQGLTSQGLPYQRLPEVRGELLVGSKEMFHFLPIGCKKGPNMDEKWSFLWGAYQSFHVGCGFIVLPKTHKQIMKCVSRRGNVIKANAWQKMDGAPSHTHTLILSTINLESNSSTFYCSHSPG